MPPMFHLYPLFFVPVFTTKSTSAADLYLLLLFDGDINFKKMS